MLLLFLASASLIDVFFHFMFISYISYNWWHATLLLILRFLSFDMSQIPTDVHPATKKSSLETVLTVKSLKQTGLLVAI